MERRVIHVPSYQAPSHSQAEQNPTGSCLIERILTRSVHEAETKRSLVLRVFVAQGRQINPHHSDMQPLLAFGMQILFAFSGHSPWISCPIERHRL